MCLPILHPWNCTQHVGLQGRSCFHSGSHTVPNHDGHPSVTNRRWNIGNNQLNPQATACFAYSRAPAVFSKWRQHRLGRILQSRPAVLQGFRVSVSNKLVAFGRRSCREQTWQTQKPHHDNQQQKSRQRSSLRQGRYFWCRQNRSMTKV